ncbi:hypothetical protein KSD_72920 [Ktedonobacter sp. SOSP1-85]|nr:hypothetical protein KSD_72920 [Ktedonobacter sp. SOSP1-85]
MSVAVNRINLTEMMGFLSEEKNPFLSGNVFLPGVAMPTGMVQIGIGGDM